MSNQGDSGSFGLGLLIASVVWLSLICTYNSREVVKTFEAGIETCSKNDGLKYVEYPNRMLTKFRCNDGALFDYRRYDPPKDGKYPKEGKK